MTSPGTAPAPDRIHHVTRYGNIISCGATGPVRVTYTANEVTCPECDTADYAELVAEAERQAYEEDAEWDADIQVVQDVAQAEQVSVWLMRHGDDGRRLVTIQASIEKDEQYAYLEDVRRTNEAAGTLPPVEPGRAQRIAEIRELADWLETNPEIPCPMITANAHLQRSVVPDEEGRAVQVRNFALATGGRYYELGQHRYAKIRRSPGVEYCFATSSDSWPLPGVEAV